MWTSGQTGHGWMCWWEGRKEEEGGKLDVYIPVSQGLTSTERLGKHWHPLTGTSIHNPPNH